MNLVSIIKQPELKQILKNLCSLSAENEVVEFKEAKTSFDFQKLDKYFSALSNEANLKGKAYVWLVFGIENNAIKGMNYSNHIKGKMGSCYGACIALVLMNK